ncbi:M50 family metallopeptidase [Dactylosporangium sp. NPDC005572]|uniref:M50 family metallopeptidase n=1 Tax=Dactylosporangium sp. NPDC005572 TaxID=3156889 RepID=UPI0033B3E2B1
MEPSQLVVIGAGLTAFAVSVVVWPVVHVLITLAHEGGHAMAVSLMGGSVKSLKALRPQGGVTTFTGLGPLGRFVTALAGYVGPSAFGLAGAYLLSRGQVRTVLWISVVLLLMALFAAGSFYTRFAIIAIGAVIVMVMRKASDGQEAFFAYTWIWFLLFGGFIHVLAFQNLRHAGPDKSSDAYVLRQLTFLPASLWSGLFWLASLTALVYGGGILLGYYR